MKNTVLIATLELAEAGCTFYEICQSIYHSRWEGFDFFRAVVLGLNFPSALLEARTNHHRVHAYMKNLESNVCISKVEYNPDYISI